jgi:hypothetical protein
VTRDEFPERSQPGSKFSLNHKISKHEMRLAGQDNACSESDDVDFTENLDALLEEFRRSKQTKQHQLINKALKEGRPFSAPAASPGCAAIRKRTEGDKILKEKHAGEPHETAPQTGPCFAL